MATEYNEFWVDPNLKGGPYGVEEDEMIINSKSSIVNIALLLGRSISSVKDRKREVKKQKTNEDARKRATFNRDAKNSRKPYTAEDDVIILDESLTRKERAILTGRSLIAVRRRIESLRDPGKVKATLEQYALFNKDGKNKWKLYTNEDDVVVLDKNFSLKDKALKLDRTINSVRGRVRVLNNRKRELSLPL